MINTRVQTFWEFVTIIFRCALRQRKCAVCFLLGALISAYILAYLLFGALSLGRIFSNAIETYNFYYEVCADQEQLDSVVGRISHIEASTDGDRKFIVSGNFAARLPENVTAWIFVEKGDDYWAKEGRIIVNANREWQHTIFEDGTPNEHFSISVWLADETGTVSIERWFDVGREFNQFEPIKNTQCMRRLDRVEGHISK